MKKEELNMMKKKKSLRFPKSALMLVICLLLVFAFGSITGMAAENTKIEIKETKVSVRLGETKVLNVEYVLNQSAIQLGCVSADETMVSAVITDNGNGKAQLVLAGHRQGSCVVAVYEASNPNIVDYVTVNCGLAQEGGVYTVNEGSSFTTVYDDRVIEYNSLMRAQNGDQLAVSHLAVERNAGIDALIASGKLWEENKSSSGLLTFYACFYDASGKLIERMPYYAKNTGAGSTVELCWYIPKGCTKIVVE